MASEATAAFAHAKCYRAFEELLVALQSPFRNYQDQLPVDEVAEEFQKYTIWAGNVGAARSGKDYKISRDYRFRESSFFKKHVSKFVFQGFWSH